MTVIEALNKSIDILNGISVPVAMINQIGAPVQQAVSLIQASLDAWDKANKEHEQKDQEPAGEE